MSVLLHHPSSRSFPLFSSSSSSILSSSTSSSSTFSEQSSASASASISLPSSPKHLSWSSSLPFLPSIEVRNAKESKNVNEKKEEKKESIGLALHPLRRSPACCRLIQNDALIDTRIHTLSLTDHFIFQNIYVMGILSHSLSDSLSSLIPEANILGKFQNFPLMANANMHDLLLSFIVEWKHQCLLLKMDKNQEYSSSYYTLHVFTEDKSLIHFPLHSRLFSFFNVSESLSRDVFVHVEFHCSSS